MEDTRKRTLAKAVSWRIIATATTMIAAYIFTKEVTIAIGIGIIESSSKLVFYYYHERAWARVAWGHVKKSRVKKVKNFFLFRGNR